MLIKLVLVSATSLLLASPLPVRKESSEFVLSPDAATGTLQAECKASSTGRCYFIFTAGSDHPSVNASVGGKVTVKSVTPGSQYCADVNPVTWSSCSPTPLPARRSTVKNDRIVTDAN